MYTRQPPANLSCMPHPLLTLECAAQSAGLDQEQAITGLAWYGIAVGKDEPILLASRSGVLIETMQAHDSHTHHVVSTLSLSPSARRDLLKLFCRMQLQDGTLLPRSQVLRLSPIVSSPLCTPSSLVDITPTRVCRPTNILALKQAAATNSGSSTGNPGSSAANPDSSTRNPDSSTRKPDSSMGNLDSSTGNLDSIATTMAMDGGEMMPVALYIVVAVIVVFVFVIICLALVVVSLYRRKCGHVEERPSAGEVVVQCISLSLVKAFYSVH